MGYLAVNPVPPIIISHRLGSSAFNITSFNQGNENRLKYMNSDNIDSAYFDSYCLVKLPTNYHQIKVNFLYKSNSSHGKFDCKYLLIKEGNNIEDGTFTNALTIDSYNATILRNVAGTYTISSLDEDSTYGIVFQFIGTGKHASSSAYYKLINDYITLELIE